MKNKIIFLSFFFFSLFQTHSQQLFTTAGAQENNVSWTIGELVFGNIQLTDMIVAQGVYDPYTSDLSGIMDARSVNYSVYPNPVVDRLHIQTDQEEAYSFVLTDMLGRTLIQDKGTSGKTISMSYLKAGQYILRITGYKAAHSFIIIKK